LPIADRDRAVQDFTALSESEGRKNGSKTAGCQMASAVLLPICAFAFE
jgi:hypothetical protein